MHLGKPLRRRMITTQPETLPEHAPVDEDAPLRSEDRAGEPIEPPVVPPVTQPAG